MREVERRTRYLGSFLERNESRTRPSRNMPRVSFQVQPALKAKEPRRARESAEAVKERGPGRNLRRAVAMIETAIPPMRAVMKRAEVDAFVPRAVDTKAMKRPRIGMSVT